MMKNKTFSDLKILRDELKVRAHLFNLETKERWEFLEEKFKHFNNKVERVAKATSDVNEELKAGQSMMIQELKDGYRKIKQALK